MQGHEIFTLADPDPDAWLSGFQALAKAERFARGLGGPASTIHP